MKEGNLLKILSIVGFALLLFLIITDQDFSAQEISVGYIEGGGVDAPLAPQAFDIAKVKYTVITKDDYKLNTLLAFDVIAIGVMAYDQNPDLQGNFRMLKDYVSKGGYLVTLDYQQDSTWKADYFPIPLQLFDDDVEEGGDIEMTDHPIWKIPNIITKEHFVGWGLQDFVADAAHEVKAPAKALLIAGGWPVVAGMQSGTGYAVFSSLQILQTLARTNNDKIVEVMENFLFWRGPMAVDVKGKLATTWAKLK